jgi:hypothetical protein
MIDQSFQGGDTGRIIPRKKKNAINKCDEFVAYARFIDEAAHGFLPFGFRADGEKTPAMAPRFVNGRFVSVSPEHSLCRAGGDGQKCGAGGSGVGRLERYQRTMVALVH